MSDAALQARAAELADLAVGAEATGRRTQPVSPETMRRISADMTIAIMEIIRAGVTIHLVAANSARGLRLLRANPRWFKPYERVVGEQIPYYKLGNGTRTMRNIDAEQVLAFAAIEMKMDALATRIAASRKVCVACMDYFGQLMRHVKLINPDPRGTLRPPRSQPLSPPPRRGRMMGQTRPIGPTFSPRQRGAAGAVLLIQAFNSLIGEYVSRREEGRYEEAIRAKEGFLRDFHEKQPAVGVLILVYFEKAIFRHPLEFSYGMTEIQARRTIQATARSGEQTSFAVWQPPLQPADVTSLSPPLTPVMLATFYRRQVFQNLEFRVADGFDDDGETDLGYAQRGKEARFWILRPPARVNAQWGSDRVTKEIDIFRWPLVSGELVECVDLDPTVFSTGSDCAFPAYPADLATDATFGRVRGISDNTHALRNYDFDHVRWIAPHRARSIGG